MSKHTHSIAGSPSRMSTPLFGWLRSAPLAKASCVFVSLRRRAHSVYAPPHCPSAGLAGIPPQTEGRAPPLVTAKGRVWRVTRLLLGLTHPPRRPTTIAALQPCLLGTVQRGSASLRLLNRVCVEEWHNACHRSVLEQRRRTWRREAALLARLPGPSIPHLGAEPLVSRRYPPQSFGFADGTLLHAALAVNLCCGAIGAAVGCVLGKKCIFTSDHLGALWCNLKCTTRHKRGHTR